MKLIIRQLRRPSPRSLVFTVILGLVYPLVTHGRRPGGLPRQGRRLADQASTGPSSARS